METHRGRRTILSWEEENTITEKLVLASCRLFDLDFAGVKTLMASDGNDVKRGYENGISSPGVLNSLRARQREITVRNCEKKDQVELKGENYQHGRTYFEILQSSDKGNPGILHDEDGLRNRDETKVDTTFGKERKFHKHTMRASKGLAKKTGAKWITAVYAVWASGRIAP